MPRRLTVLAVASLVLAAAPALADPPPAPQGAAPPSPLVIGRCLWTAFPKATRDALTGSGPSIDDVTKALDGLNPALMDMARAQCPNPATTADANRAAETWTSLALTEWAQTQLYRQDKITPAALQATWAKVSPAARAKLAADAGKPPDEERANLAPISQALGLTTTGDVDLLGFWVLAQLHMQALNGEGAAP